jgi:hypothetical protein
MKKILIIAVVAALTLTSCRGTISRTGPASAQNLMTYTFYDAKVGSTVSVEKITDPDTGKSYIMVISRNGVAITPAN